MHRRAIVGVAVALVAAVVASPAARGSEPPAPPGRLLAPFEIQQLFDLLPDNPLLGGQVPPRRHRWVNRDASIFVQFDSNNPALATRARYIGISVKGVFCAEAQPDVPAGAFTHFHRLTAPSYGMGHGGAPGELGFWLTWVAVDEFVTGGRTVKPGFDYQFAPTPPPTCGDNVPEPEFTAPGERDLTREDIAELVNFFDDILFFGNQKTPWATRWVNERAGIYLEFDHQSPRKAQALRYIGLALRGTFCAQQQPHTDFSHYHKAYAKNFNKGSGGRPGETEGYWMTTVAADDFRDGGRLVAPGPDRGYLPTPPPQC